MNGARSNVTDDVAAACRALIDAHGGTRLATRVSAGRRHAITIVSGYVALLVDYTDEDREAKGLRSLQADAAPRVAMHDTVIEAATREPLLLLTGPSGCGKSTSLLHLALHLAGATIGDARWTLDGLTRPAPRNEAGIVALERWLGAPPVPLRIVVEGPTALGPLLSAQGPLGRQVLDGSLDTDCLLLIDGAERLGTSGPALLRELAALAADRPSLRAIVAGDADVCRTWRRPAAFVHRRIVPLVAGQRATLRRNAGTVDDRSGERTTDAEIGAQAGLFTLALECDVVDGTSIDVIDRWLAEAATRNAIDVETLIGARDEAHPSCFSPGLDDGDRRRLDQPFVRQHLAVRRLSSAPVEAIVARYRTDPLRWSTTIGLVARRFVASGRPLGPLVTALMNADHDRDASSYGAIEAMRIAERAPRDAVDAGVHGAIRAALVSIVDEGRLPATLREEAARAIAIDGDPRDLERLIEIDAGSFTMGSTTHPNSSPPHVVTVAACRIGRYPVTNERYRRFVEETGRPWPSRDGRLSHRSNGPAVDVTWHDARAYCAWLTERWRAARRIAADDVVRLPTEAEWERAARGPGALDPDGFVYPWPGPWQDDHANAEEAGFNDTCAVGLFPMGRSPDGCDDMAGQVWEWTSTLWGEDMAAPRFAYPYRDARNGGDDGREDLDAPPAVRRVLRGACFLSPREKANCVYRGSLEPDGYWRGNGFRIVVAPG